MRLLSCALTAAVWVAALLGTATPAHAHYLAGSAPGSLSHGEEHEAGGFQHAGNTRPGPKGRARGPHGPINWPKGKLLGAALRNAAGPDGLPELQGRLANGLDQADRRLRLRGKDNKP
ncbi:hypothetical protein PHYSODRAFT_356046 [Phytophthora sojae]|uniref:RxLR effector protein n=1 Tax=Phytophthora sojae (strain P6497) TaxID=1094619 RepID=G5AAN3_PHYSP|nr:hypothetical protein PHYSODRAFT_356046 [Phytophthora sojae]EGZ07662.1 hypothetical protein PHYSODRAFT_356046 [Phytophthora sojae]|eukprot:XP_009537228.1 hypothetical protein PHYSODRAFT_356046 [Phytophthora sojae]